MVLSGLKIHFTLVKITENYNEDSHEKYFLEVDVTYLKNLRNLHNDLPFLPERMKIEEVGKLVANLHDKKEKVIDTRNLKQALNQGLVLKMLDRVIKFNQNAWLTSYIIINTELEKKQNKILKNRFSS